MELPARTPRTAPAKVAALRPRPLPNFEPMRPPAIPPRMAPPVCLFMVPSVRHPASPRLNAAMRRVASVFSLFVSCAWRRAPLGASSSWRMKAPLARRERRRRAGASGAEGCAFSVSWTGESASPPQLPAFSVIGRAGSRPRISHVEAHRLSAARGISLTECEESHEREK